MNNTPTLEHYIQKIKNGEHFALYFSDGICSVAESIGPKLIPLFHTFPNISLSTVILPLHPDISGYFQIFSSPCLLIYIDGKESLKFAGNFGINELESKLNRLYTLRF